MPNLPNLTPELIKTYLDEVSTRSSKATSKRKTASLKKFVSWAQKQGIVKGFPVFKVSKAFYSSLQDKIIKRLDQKPRVQKIVHSLFYKRPNWYRTYHDVSITNYIHIAILVIFSVALGFGAYDQFFRRTPTPLAYPTSLTPPNKYLSFQGRLTNELGNPITVSTNLVFKLYDAASAGNTLWNAAATACAITPDSDGIFSTLLGSTCGGAIASTVFSENPNVWVGVKVGTDDEATPRIQIATVGYALNAETLQGYPPSATGTINTIPVINNSGDLIIGAASPTIQSTSGTFAIDGQAISIITGTGSAGNITIAPDGVGQLLFIGGTTTTDFTRITDANLTSGDLISGYVGNNTATGNLLALSSGSSETDRFTVSRTGQTYIAGSVGIGTTAPSNELEVVGDIELANLYDNDASNFFDGGCSATTSITGIDSTGAITCTDITGVPASSIAFSGITTGTNTQAAMWVGSGASLTYAGGTATSGVINANQLLGGTWAIPGTIGSTTPSTGAFTTLSASGALAANGGDITSTATTFNLLNSTVTTLNIGSAATTVSLGAATGTTTINNATTAITGNLDVNGSSNDIAGTLNLSGGALTSTGALTVTPAAGNNFNLVLSTTGDLAVNTNQLYVDTSAASVGIGNTAPGSKLQVTGDIASEVATGVEGLKLISSGVNKMAMKWAANSVSLDVPSTAKLSNSGFETDLSSWSEVPSYTLNDQFTTDRAAGAVNGTSAEPTGGTRTVTDTESKLSIASSALTFAGGKTTPAWGDPGIWYPAVTRAAGKIFSTLINASTTDKYLELGLSNGTSGEILQSSFFFDASGNIKTYVSGLGQPIIGSYASSTPYTLAIVLRSTGAYYFIKGGVYTNWTLLYIENSFNAATVYPSVQSYNATFTADNFKIPTATWLPTPLAYDTFTRADGAIGSSETTGPDSQTTPSLAWTGSTYAISTNKAVNTPTLGSEMWDAPAAAFTSGTYAWTAYGTNTIANDANSLKITYVDNSQGASVLLKDAADLSSNLTAGEWYIFNFDSKVSAGNSVDVNWGGSGSIKITETATAFTNHSFIFKAASATTDTIRMGNMGTGEIIWLDNLSLKPLTLSSLFSSVSTSDADVIADANVTLTAGTQAGLVTNLDSTSSPANFLIAYHNGTNVVLDKNVAGTYTNLISTAATYSAGATLRVITYHSDANTLKVRVYYNNVMIGTEQTVTNAGIISNTKHGLFSTYSANSLDNFTLWARGTGAEYTDAPFEELTPTRDTTIKYAGTASAKLVAGGTDANFLQSVNVGDTSTYTLTAYAYTDGSAVTTADLDLYYDTGVLSTTFTSVGSGWYRLTGSLTGVASAKNYGVRVHAGKTVYIDKINLYSGSGEATALNIFNSLTGLGGMNVESTSTLNSGLSTQQALIVKGAINQIANLQEWQNSSGTVLGYMDASGNLNLTASTNLIFGGTTSLGETTSAVDSGAYLVGTYDEFDNSNSANVQAVLNDLDAAITTGGSGSMWTLASGVIYPTSATNDFAIGGTTLAASMFGIDESAGNFYFGYDNSANPTLNFEATDGDAGEFGFNTNDSFFFSNANVGIGTTGPAHKLELADHTTAAGGIGFGTDVELYREAANTLNTPDILHISGGGALYFGTNYATSGTIGLPNNNSIDWRNAANSANIAGIKVFTDNSLYLRGGQVVIDSTGNVGIGTTSPTNILSLGNAAAQKFWIENTAAGTVGRALTVAAGGTVAGGTDITGGNLILQSGLGTGTGASTISFQTGTTLTTGTTLQTMSTKMTILGTGSVGIGTTAPSNELEVVGDIELANLYDNDASNFFDGGCSATTTITGIDSTGAITCTDITGVPASSIAFSGITTGTNTQAVMTVGTGASLNYAGSGTINASSLIGNTWAIPGTIGSGTANTGAFTTLTSSGNSTLGTGSSSVNSLGAGASSSNVIGSTTTPGALTLHGATTLDNTLTVSGSYLTSLGGNLTVTGTAWTATPTISGLITATSGLTANGALTANAAFTLGDNGDLGSVNTSDWDISTAGAMTGISGISNDAGYTQSGTTANTFTGTSTFSNATYSALFTGGNVGIGTTAPSNELEVVGDIELANLYDNDASNFFDGGCSATTTITGIDSTGAITCTDITGVPASSIAFSGITSGTNTQAAMWVGSGSSLTYAGGTATSGVINANQLLGNTWAIPGTIGSGTPNTGAFTTLSSTGNTTFGDASGDSVTANADAWTFANDTNFALSGGVNGLSFDTSTLSIDATNDRVGIGTTGPSYKLEVSGGSVGIPTTSASATQGLVVTDGTTKILNYQGLDLSSISYAFFGTNRTYGVGGWSSTGWYGTRTAASFQIQNDTLNFYQFAASSNSNTEVFRIESGGEIGILHGGTIGYALGTAQPVDGLAISGNVGIGTTSPGKGTSVKALTITTTSAQWPVAIELWTNENSINAGEQTGRLSMFSGTAANEVSRIAGYQPAYNENTGGLIFSTSNAGTLSEKMRITETGNVGIGTTGPSNELEVVGDIELANLYDNDASNFFDGGCSATTSITGIDSTGAITCTDITGVPASSIAFSGITTGSNTQAVMTVGTGASLNYAGSGTINASSLIGNTWAIPGTIGSGTPNTGAFTTLTSSGNSTIGTGASSANSLGAGASSTNVIGSTTTPGALTLHGATTLDNTFTVSGSNLTSLGGNLTVTGTAWTATPTISGLVTMTSGFDSNAASNASSLTLDANTGNALTISGTGFATDIVLQNGETIDNDIDGTILLTATTSKTSGNLYVGTSGTGTITSGLINSQTISSAANFTGTVAVAGDLTITGDDLFMATNTANYFLMADGTNYNPTSPADARIGLGLTAGGTGDIWVEKAGDTMTGNLTFSGSQSIIGGTATTADLTLQTTSGVGTTGADMHFLVGNNGATEAMTILNSGNVGIGTTNPLAKLEISGGDLKLGSNNILGSEGTVRINLGDTTTLSNTTFTLNGSSTLTASSLATFTTSSALALGGATSLTFSADNATIYGSDVASGDLTLEGTSNATKTTSYVILQPTSGNVGIGTTSPAYKLDILTSTASDRGVNILNSATTGTNFGIVSVVNGAGTGTNYGGSFTSSGADTANIGVYIGAISGTGTANGISMGNISATGATAFGINLGTISGANATSQTQIDFGAISGGTLNAYGINMGTITGGTTANYSIKIGAITSTGATNSYGIYQSAISGTGTNVYGLRILASTATGTSAWGALIAGPSGAATNNYGLNITQPTGSTHDAALEIGTASTGAGDWAIYNSSTADNYFAGNVGIGTAGPAAKLAVDGGGTNQLLIGVLSDATTYNAISLNGTLINNAKIGIAGGGGTDKDIYYDVPATGAHNFRVAAATKMVMDTNGNVGIGTASPDAKLHVIGSLCVESSDTACDGGIAAIAAGDLIAGDSTMTFHVDASANTLYFQRSTADVSGAWFSGRKSRGTTAAPATVVTGDDVFLLRGYAYAGATPAWDEVARIHFDTEGTIDNGIAPGLMRFYTNNSAGTLTQNMSINSAGLVTVTDLTCTNCIERGELNTALEEKSSSNVCDGTPSTAKTTQTFTSSAAYGFFPQGYYTACSAPAGEGNGYWETPLPSAITTYSTRLRTVVATQGGTSGTVYAYARINYIQASPPYYIDDYYIKHFLYVLYDKNTRQFKAASSAEDPPWGNDYNKRFNNPHPFADYSDKPLPSNLGIALIDPTDYELWARNAEMMGLSFLQYINEFKLIDLTQLTPPDSPSTKKPIQLGDKVEWKRIVDNPNPRSLEQINNLTNNIDTPSQEKADLAEYFPSGFLLTPGDVVEFVQSPDPKHPTHFQLSKAQTPNSPKLAGVISTNPAQTLNNPIDINDAPLAMVGRVSTKISNFGGNIKVGDPITASEIPSIGQKSNKPGQIIGVALEPFEADKATQSIVWDDTVHDWKVVNQTCEVNQPKCYAYGKITVFINLSLHDPDVYLTDTGDFKIVNNELGTTNYGSNQQSLSSYSIVQNSTNQIIDRIGAFADLVSANIKTGSLVAKEAFIEGGFKVADTIIAGAIETKKVTTENLTAFQGTVDNLLIKNGLVSPVVQTKLISPLADESDVIIKLGKKATSGEPSGVTPEESSGFGQLIIQDATGSAVASISSEGDATFSGELHANKIYADEIVSEKLTDTLTNQSMSIEKIEALLKQVEQDQDLLAQASTWNTGVATESATISSLIAGQLAVGDLFVTNQAAMNSLSLLDSLTVGSDMVIQGVASGSLFNTINTLSSPLSLQSLALAPVEIMAGKIKILTNGDVEIQGNLYIAGKIEAKGLTLKSDSQNDKEATDSGFLKIIGNQGTDVASINASGSAVFGSVSTDKLVIAGGEATTSSSLLSGVVTETNATAGKGLIPAGVKEITIKNPKITDNTLVYVTPTSETQNNVLFVKSKEAGKFVVGFTNPLTVDVTFNWWIIEVQSAGSN